MKKLTKQTIDILKNFAGINKNLFVKSGSTLSTISEAQNIFATATVSEQFENEFGIYDLNEFLSALAMFSDPDIEFDSTTLQIMSGKSKIKYRFADENVLTYPTKSITMPNAELEVVVTDDMISQVRKASSIFGNAVASIHNDGNEIFLSVIDPKNSTANSFSIQIGETSSTDKFDFQILIANLKLIPGDYDVKISSRNISQWNHQSESIQYFLALEKTSTYSK